MVLPGPKFFEFLMVEEPMEFQTTASDPAKDLEVIQSKENDVFYGYMKFIQQKRNERAPFDAVLQDSAASAQEVATAREGIQALTNEVNEYQHYLTHDPRDFLFGKYLTMLNEPQGARRAVGSWTRPCGSTCGTGTTTGIAWIFRCTSRSTARLTN